MKKARKNKCYRFFNISYCRISCEKFTKTHKFAKNTGQIKSVVVIMRLATREVMQAWMLVISLQ